jgi:hypothetical protein
LFFHHVGLREEIRMSQIFDTASREVDLNAANVHSAVHFATRLADLLRHPAVHLVSALLLVALGVAGFDLMRNLPH